MLTRTLLALVFAATAALAEPQQPVPHSATHVTRGGDLRFSSMAAMSVAPDAPTSSVTAGTDADSAAASAGLVINATFDSTITNSPKAAAIMSAVNHAISVYQSMFSDQVTVSILFR